MNLDQKQIEKRYEEIWAIYEEAFPECERRTKDGQRNAMQRPEYRLLIREEEGMILAFLGYWELSDCCFVEHLATTPACRGKGYGKDLVMECLGETTKPIFLEIEPITDADPMTARRAGFYERLGFCCNHWPYRQMPLKPQDEPIDLWVMSHGREFDAVEFEPHKREIYGVVYGVQMQ